MKPMCMFSYYGSKSQRVHHYPAPNYPLIVEPFAGGACYALRHAEGRQVVINDLSVRTYNLWQYLTTTPMDEILMSVPDAVVKGQNVDELVPDGAHPGLRELLRANANMGTLGSSGTHKRVTWFAELHWRQVKERLRYFLPKVRGWKVSNFDYKSMENIEATWFIDPPYNNAAGKRYLHSSIDYSELAAWCKTRRGQVIVCENVGADWLDFKPLVIGKSRGGVRRAMEAIWTNDGVD